ncbi:MAG TPA: ATP-dependent sacrificial sulfur transferase LarE [Thermoanaerobaculia bacterium]|nr:ATP-dependent sacrificial sulfur transferase LarE [Thermoanaerobaculia bacterium]
MESSSWERLRAALLPHRETGVVVAFSGGLDSSVLLDAAVEALGARRVAAFTAVSPSLSARDLADARRIASEIGTAHHEEETSELSDPGYVANAGDRCFFCKRELFSVIGDVKERLGLTMNRGSSSAAPAPPAVAYGYHRDDDADFRPGLKAALAAGAIRPLYEAGLGKRELREIARARGRSFAEKPSGACLSSRIPAGTPVNARRLAAVEAVEEWLRDRGYRQLRARLERDDRMRLETDPSDVVRLAREIAAAPEELLAVARAHGVLELAVDPRGYGRPGETR